MNFNLSPIYYLDFIFSSQNRVNNLIGVVRDFLVAETTALDAASALLHLGMSQTERAADAVLADCDLVAFWAKLSALNCEGAILI